MLDGSILFVEQVYCDQLLCGYRVCNNSWSKNLTVIMTALIVLPVLGPVVKPVFTGDVISVSPACILHALKVKLPYH